MLQLNVLRKYINSLYLEIKSNGFYLYKYSHELLSIDHLKSSYDSDLRLIHGKRSLKSAAYLLFINLKGLLLKYLYVKDYKHLVHMFAN